MLDKIKTRFIMLVYYNIEYTIVNILTKGLVFAKKREYFRSMMSVVKGIA